MTEHATALYDWTIRRVADRRDAEEIVAETLVRAWRHYDQFDPQRGSERAWLFGIARNTASDWYRRSRRHLHIVGDDLVTDLADEDEADRVADASVVHDALARLPEHHRTVIVEGFFFGRTSTQIAEVLGIPTGTVKSRMYYGMRALRAALEEQGVLR